MSGLPVWFWRLLKYLFMIPRRRGSSFIQTKSKRMNVFPEYPRLLAALPLTVSIFQDRFTVSYTVREGTASTPLVEDRLVGAVRGGGILDEG